MREITVDGLPDIARGAAVLGTAGGGDLGRVLAPTHEDVPVRPAPLRSSQL